MRFWNVSRVKWSKLVSAPIITCITCVITFLWLFSLGLLFGWIQVSFVDLERPEWVDCIKMSLPLCLGHWIGFQMKLIIVAHLSLYVFHDKIFLQLGAVSFPQEPFMGSITWTKTVNVLDVSLNIWGGFVRSRWSPWLWRVGLQHLEVAFFDLWHVKFVVSNVRHFLFVDALLHS